MFNKQNILLIVGFLIIMYLLLGNNENFKEQRCVRTAGTLCPLGNRPHRCGPNCCKCKCNTDSC